MTTLPQSRSDKCPRCGAAFGEHAQFGFCSRCAAAVSLSEMEVAELSEDELAAVLPRTAASSSSRTRFGDYELLEEIGRGGMGVVYRARQRSLNRMVAIKMLLFGGLASPDRLRRFRNEAAATAALEHANIVRVLDVAEHEGQPFIAMEFIAGTDMAQLVREGPLAARQAAGYVEKIARAIEFAHQRGVLHRDLKSSNVLVDAFDEPRVTDFGLARNLADNSDLTLSGQTIGSPNFMPPEQAAGELRRVGPASDVYGLGAILYHLLTARPPFLAETFEATLAAVRERNPVPLRQLNEKIPRDLETICLKCLEKDPAKRYATAQELADDLARYLEGEPVHARPVSRTEKVWRWCRRKPAIATLGAMVLVLVLVVVLGAPVAIFRINRARSDAERNRADLERNLYAAHMQLASESLRHGAIGQVQELLKQHYPVKGREDLRGFEWRYLAKAAADQTGLVTHQFQGLKFRKAHDSPRLVIAGNTLYHTPYGKDDNFEVDPRPILAWELNTWAPISLALPLETNSALWWYPDTEAALAVNAKDQTVTVYRLPHLEKGPIIPLPGKAIQANVSKDFHTLAVAFRDGDLRHVLVWDLTGNAQQRIFGEFRGRLSRMEFSPDSTVLLVEWDQREIALWSVTGDKALPSPPIDPVADWSPSPFFAPHSTRFFLANRGQSKELQMWDWSSGQLTTVYHAPLTGLWALSFSPDGALLATGWNGEVIALTDTKDFRTIGALHGHTGYILAVDFSPSGRLLATASRDRTAKLWDAKTQNELATLPDNEQQLGGVLFTPDEKSVLTLGIEGEIKVWNLPALLQRGVLLTTTNVDADIALSADERVLATSDGAVHLWDLAQGREIRSFPTDESWPFKLAFSPKDTLLALLGQHSLRLLNYQSEQTNILAIAAPWDFRCAVFSPDGRELAFSGEKNIMLCDVATLKLRSFAHCDEQVTALAFSPDGSLLASGHNGGGLSLWNRDSGNNITHIVGTEAHALFVLSVDFSPDGRFLASAGGDPTGKIWDVSPSGLRLRRTLRGDFAMFFLLRFFPDGRRAISSNDRTQKLWDTETGLEVGTLYGHRGGVNQVAFSHDGNTIYTIGNDGDVRTWQAPPLARFAIPPERQE